MFLYVEQDVSEIGMAIMLKSWKLTNIEKFREKIVLLSGWNGLNQ